MCEAVGEPLPSVSAPFYVIAHRYVLYFYSGLSSRMSEFIPVQFVFLIVFSCTWQKVLTIAKYLEESGETVRRRRAQQKCFIDPAVQNKRIYLFVSGTLARAITQPKHGGTGNKNRVEERSSFINTTRVLEYYY